ncbi:hypothetical protein ABW19_dt0209352 [Dactylella cylindrospora]|nr:hypothetical protein ABW19_dt0209352 [Dactylella cylindrospora]
MAGPMSSPPPRQHPTNVPSPNNTPTFQHFKHPYTSIVLPLNKTPTNPILDLLIPPRLSSHLKGVAAGVMPSSLPPPPPLPSNQGDDPTTAYGKFKRYAGIWARGPIAPALTAGLVALLYPASAILRHQKPPILPRPLPIPFFSSIFLLSSYMSYSGYPRDSAGVLSAWSMVYLLMNARRGRMGVNMVGGGQRVGVAMLMGWNAVSGTGVFLFGWGGRGGGGGWKMRTPEVVEGVGV